MENGLNCTQNPLQHRPRSESRELSCSQSLCIYFVVGWLGGASSQLPLPVQIHNLLVDKSKLPVVCLRMWPAQINCTAHRWTDLFFRIRPNFSPGKEDYFLVYSRQSAALGSKAVSLTSVGWSSLVILRVMSRSTQTHAARRRKGENLFLRRVVCCRRRPSDLMSLELLQVPSLLRKLTAASYEGALQWSELSRPVVQVETHSLLSCILKLCSVVEFLVVLCFCFLLVCVFVACRFFFFFREARERLIFRGSWLEGYPESSDTNCVGV